jgi:hypothetical protein
MDKAEARSLVERCLPAFAKAGLTPFSASDIVDVSSRAIASLWAGMGNVYKISIKSATAGTVDIVAKRIELPRVCDSIGDQRKKDSYDVEAAFYKTHAEKIIKAGAIVPFPLHVEQASRGANVTICMTMLDGRSSARGDSEAFIGWLAKLHAHYWGTRADEAVKNGLQAQGCYWHLDTRPDEHARMGTSGFMGRLKLAARAIDLRLKADPMQSVCHGDAKGANIVYRAPGEGGVACDALVYDFQYCGKACVAKDLAYFCNVDAPSSMEEPLLRRYHAELSALLSARGDTPPTFESLQTAFELALADWRRFTEIGLGGWGDADANRRVAKLLDRLDGGKALGSEQAYIDAMNREFPV